MLIVCPNCATSYRVNSSSLGASGRSVRCVRCRNVWFAHDPGALGAIAQAHRLEVSALLNAGSAETPEAPADDIVAIAPAGTEGALVDATPAAASPSEQAHEGAEPPASEPANAAEWSDPDPMPPAQETIEDAPAEAIPQLPSDKSPAEDIETFAARRAPRVKRRRLNLSLPVLPIGILALLALDVALIGWRADVVRVAPQTASLYAAIGLPVNLRGLAFTGVSTATETNDGVQVMVVEGTIASASTRMVEVPRLRFSVRNATGQEIYAWTALPTRSILAPGETLAFRSRLASPPPDARNVLVRFFNRRDLVAGVQ
jgi:predicted Zn finger-like uncharacterized protein